MDREKAKLVVVSYKKLNYIHAAIRDIATTDTHEHNALELGVVLRGTVTVDTWESTRQISQGSVFLLNAFEPHSIRSENGAAANVLSLHLSPTFAKDYCVPLSNIRFSTDSLTPETDEKLCRLALEAAQAFFQDQSCAGLECAGRVALLLAAALQTVPNTVYSDWEKCLQAKEKGRRRRIADYISRHYKERITLSELAEMEGVTPVYLSGIFQKLFCMSFQEYLNLIRLEKAVLLLHNPKICLVDVCLESGFSDTRYLNVVCRKKYGCNAAEYRKRYLQQHAQNASKDHDLQDEETEYDETESLTLLRRFMQERDYGFSGVV